MKTEHSRALAVTVGSASGLRISTLKRYAKSELLERDDHGIPIYMHHQRCPSFCDFACNGAHGDHIATDIDNLGKPNGQLSNSGHQPTS